MVHVLGSAEWARMLVWDVFDVMPYRRAHMIAVGEKAGAVARMVMDCDQTVLTAAGYLHDIGYAVLLRDTGAHQIDGGRWLASLGLHRLAALVAHHSCARFEVGLLGLHDLLAAFPREAGAMEDALTYCDLTTGPRGEDMEADERLSEVRRRYEPQATVVRALALAEPELLAAVARTKERVRQSKVAAERSAK